MESNRIAGHLSESHGSPQTLGASACVPVPDTTTARGLLNGGYEWTPNGWPHTPVREIICCVLDRVIRSTGNLDPILRATILRDTTTCHGTPKSPFGKDTRGPTPPGPDGFHLRLGDSKNPRPLHSKLQYRDHNPWFSWSHIFIPIPVATGFLLAWPVPSAISVRRLSDAFLALSLSGAHWPNGGIRRQQPGTYHGCGMRDRRSDTPACWCNGQHGSEYSEESQKRRPWKDTATSLQDT